MSRYYRNNPDQPVNHCWVGGGRIINEPFTFGQKREAESTQPDSEIATQLEEDVRKKPLLVKRYYARIPHTGWFVRVPRWIYNRWPWAGVVEMTNEKGQT